MLQPIQDPNEMDMTLSEVSVRVGVTEAELSRALASYVRSILSGNAPIDRFANGDRTALTMEQQAGLQLFRGKGNCTACHVGPTFSDERFHNTGIAWQDGRLHDEGRAVVTSLEADRGAFKTPTLREISRTAPYMHDGSLGTLEDVVEYYDRGGNRNSGLDPELRLLKLTDAEKRALTAFLHALTGTVVEGPHSDQR